MERTEPCPHVVVLGGGFGGLTTAMELARLRSSGHECDITVIDRRTHHLYTPWLYEIATGHFSPRAGASVADEERALIEGAAAPFAGLGHALAHENIRVEYDEVSGVDWTHREVRLSSGRHLNFDHLIIALGAMPDFYGIEGLKEHSHPMYTLRDGLAIRRHLYDLVSKRRSNAIPHIRVVIGGAGPTGVEFASELAMFFKDLVAVGDLTPSDYSIEMVEAASRPLASFPEEMSGWARTRLEKLGIKLLLDTCIKGAHKDHIVLTARPLKTGEDPDALICDIRPGSQKEVTTDLLVWCGGSRANPVLSTFSMNLDARGKIEIDESLAVRGHENVWALGDCASLADPASKRPVPPLAQAAIKQGRVVAENITRSMRKQGLLKYRFPHMHAIVPLGGSYAIAEVFGIRFKGRLAHILRLAADARYFFRTLPFGIAWRMFRAAFGVFTKNN